MMKKSTFVLCMLVLFLFTASMIHAQYKFFNIPSCSFRPMDEDYTYTYYWDYSYADSDCPSSPYFFAPIYLPQDATIVSVTLSYYDSDSSNDMSFSVIRTNLYTKSYQTLFSGSSSGSSGEGEIVDSTLNNGSRIVKNNSFYYAAYISIPAAGVGSSLKFYCLKIKYQ